MVTEVVNVVIVMMMMMITMVKMVSMVTGVIVVVAVTKAEQPCIIRTSKPNPCELGYSTLPRSFGSRSAILPFLIVRCNCSINDGVQPPSQRRSLLSSV